MARPSGRPSPSRSSTATGRTGKRNCRWKRAIQPSTRRWRPRPGHADLAGALKYNFPDARYVLERASARESTSRVAAGAIAKLMLRAVGIEVLSHVIRVGRVELEREAKWKRSSPL